MDIIGFGGLGKKLVENLKKSICQSNSIEKYIVVDTECEICPSLNIEHLHPDDKLEVKKKSIIALGCGRTSTQILESNIEFFDKDEVLFFIVTPFAFEGKKRMENAKRIIELLKKGEYSYYLYDNQKLLQKLPDSVSVPEALEMVHQDYRKFIQSQSLSL